MLPLPGYSYAFECSRRQRANNKQRVAEENIKNMTGLNKTRPAIALDGSFLHKTGAAQAPQPLTEGVGNTFLPEIRDLPEVSHPDSIQGFEVLSYGLDTVQESFKAQVRSDVAELLENAKAEALERDPSGETGISVKLGGFDVLVQGHGAKGGVAWVVKTDSWLALISRAGREWGVSVRYTSEGLWLRGLAEIRDEATAFLWETCIFSEDEHFCSLTRADFCFDVYAPHFKEEMRPGVVQNFVMHSSCKKKEEGKESATHWSEHGRGHYVQTVTIGAQKKGFKGLQVQLYDKTTEITEASGKTWFHELWGFEPGTDDLEDGDVWRLELRFGKDFLKNRNIRDLNDFIQCLDQLKTEALYKVRLTERNGDTNRARRPFHPFWSACISKINEKPMLPLGRKVTGQRTALLDQAVKQVAGTVRSAVVLANVGDFNEDLIDEILDEAVKTLHRDKEHRKKVDLARDRYASVSGGSIRVGCDDI